MSDAGNAQPELGTAASEWDLQCSIVRRELEQQRQLLQQQWCPANTQSGVDTAHFPRSATMRFLVRHKNSALLIQLAKWQVARHFPGLAFWRAK